MMEVRLFRVLLWRCWVPTPAVVSTCIPCLHHRISHYFGRCPVKSPVGKSLSLPTYIVGAMELHLFQYGLVPLQLKIHLNFGSYMNWLCLQTLRKNPPPEPHKGLAYTVYWPTVDFTGGYTSKATTHTR
ncbi:hypothetical protein F5Y19DRAFT_208032 [Xylariaceae sp. FL1651]|nr:hypothetical protein F5Y19DRAFT_208032 [Xylariaceae sp. FL1651]